MYKFVNPYNFIPFGDKAPEKKIKEDVYRGEKNQKDLLTGWLDIKMIIKKPIIIPDGAHPDLQKIDGGKSHLKYGFFQMYNPETGKREYAVPGSELRGLIRSIYETVTNSCVPFLLDDKPMSQRLPLYASLKRRGLLGFDGKRWTLYDTDVTLEKVTISFKKIKGKDGKEKLAYIFKTCNSEIRELPGEEVKGKGWIQYNLPVNINQVYHVAYLKKTKILHRWEDAPIKNHKYDGASAEAYKQLSAALHRDGVINKKNNSNYKCNQALIKALDKACKNPKQLVPVYYCIVKEKEDAGKGEENRELVYMSGSSAGRIGQRRKWADIISEYKPCENDLCPACLLFGTTAGDGMKGHVRFTDAFYNGRSVKKTTHTLQILSSPRTSAFEFYLKKPADNATYWNFDFYGALEGGAENDSHTVYHHLEYSMPRGRKMYWHHDTKPDDIIKRKINNTMTSIDEGSFRFQIFFDQINRDQLNDLIWIVNLGENSEDGKFGHKLGHAKPLGYGSVKMVVTGGSVRSFIFNRNKNYQYSIQSLESIGINIDNIKPSFDVNSEEVRTLLKMCRFDAVGGEIVDYPRIEKDGKIYDWFSENRINCKSLKVLPEPLNEIISLGGEPGNGESGSLGKQP